MNSTNKLNKSVDDSIANVSLNKINYDFSVKGKKFYIIVNKEGKHVGVSKKFFDSHKKFVKKVVSNGAYIYYSYNSKERHLAYKPQFLIGAARSISNFFMDKYRMFQGIKHNWNSPLLNAFVIDFSTILADIFGFKSISSWLTLLCRIYSLILRVCDFKQHQYYLQSNFVDLAAFVTLLGLPKDFIEKIRVFQTLATSKITGSVAIIKLFRVFVNLIFSFLDWVLLKSPDNKMLLAIKEFIEGQFSFVIHVETIESVCDLYSKYVKNSQVMLDLRYREEVLKLETKITDARFIDFINTSDYKSMKEIVNAFKANILKYAKTYTISSRVEPVCFILEGPAGCRKSTIMNAIVQICKRDDRSVYTHIIPSIDAGKDFYDDYENQNIFVTDDIGQQGASQWRTIINFVAPVKMPLECANAEKKNTKFFNSRLILGTTNLLSEIQSFTSKDCITSKEALFRRVHLLKFGSVPGEYNISYWKYDYITSNAWKNEYLENMEGCDLPLSFTAKYDDKKGVHDMLIWIYKMMLHAEKVNVDYSDASTIPTHLLDDILSKAKKEDDDDFFDAVEGEGNANVNQGDDLRPQGKFLPDFSLDNYVKVINDYTPVRVKPVAAAIGMPFYYLSNYIVEKSKEMITSVFEYMSLGNVSYAIGAILVVYMLYRILAYSDNNEDFVEQVYKLQAKMGVDTTSTQSRIKNNIMLVKVNSVINGEEKEQIAFCMITGKFILINDHMVGESPMLNIYRNATAMKNNDIMFNNLPVKVVKRFYEDDMCVLKCESFPVTPVKVFRFHEQGRDLDLRSRSLIVINPDMTIPVINKVNASINNHIVAYNSVSTSYKMEPNSTITYPISLEGMCGSMLVDEFGNPHGHHVCGRESEGVVRLWSKNLSTYVRNLEHSRDIQYDIMDKEKENYSGLRLYQTDLICGQGFGKSTIIPSDLNDLTKDPIISGELDKLVSEDIIGERVEKMPAILDVFGKETLVKLAEKSYKPIPTLPREELKFAKECLLDMFPKEFSKIDLLEAAFGNDSLVRLNKDAANGYGYKKEKEIYLDYENKQITPEFERIITEFKDRVISDNLSPADLLCKEALKDELRVLAKAVKPRTFRVLPLHHTLLTKQYLAKLFIHLKDNMWDNGICIGFNPYIDFDRLYKELNVMDLKFDGDFGSYDGSAPSQIQDLIAECVMERFIGSEEDRKILHTLLCSMIRSFVLTREKLTLTTHSMPSGCWVTALFNSLLNRCLTAICLKRNKKNASLRDFRLIKDYVLGDDKIVGVPKCLEDVVNALTMKEVAESLGMTYTDAKKGDINFKGKRLEECQFLKRSFMFNIRMNRVVGLLDMNTIVESLRFFSADKEYSVVMYGKLTAMQYELFLYGNHGLVLMNRILTLAKENNIFYKVFTPEHIAKTMCEEDTYAQICFSLNKFFSAAV